MKEEWTRTIKDSSTLDPEKLHQVPMGGGFLVNTYEQFGGHPVETLVLCIMGVSLQGTLLSAFFLTRHQEHNVSLRSPS